MEETRKAILLIDTQNEFISKDGKLYNNVAEVFQDTKMLEKLPSFIQQAREAGVVVVHSPLSLNPNNSEQSELDLHDVFVEGSWNAEFADGYQPAKRDYIMNPRKKFCCFRGSKLLTLLQRERIDVLFIAGFLTDGSILETVKTADELGLGSKGLETYVLSDGCATSSLKVQQEMINKILPMYSEIISIKEASLMIEQGLTKVLRTSEGLRSPTYDPVTLLRHEMIEKWFPVERLVSFLDDGNLGMVSNDEFEDTLTELNLASNVSAKKIFRMLDKQGVGEISTKELSEALRPQIDDVQMSKEEEVASSAQPSLLVGVVASFQLKVSMMKFVEDHIAFFRRVKLVTNRSTARVLEESMGLVVEQKVSNVGSENEIKSLLSQGKVCVIFSLKEETEALNHLCSIHNVLFANNPATAHAVVSLLESTPYGYACLTGNNAAYHISKTESIISRDEPTEVEAAPKSKMKKKSGKKSKKAKKAALKGNVSQRLISFAQEHESSEHASLRSDKASTKSDNLLQVNEEVHEGEGSELPDQEQSIQNEYFPSVEEELAYESEESGEATQEPPGGNEPAFLIDETQGEEEAQEKNVDDDIIQIPDAIAEASLTSPRIQGRKERIQRYIDDGKSNIAKKMITSTLAEINGLGLSTPSNDQGFY